MESLARIDLNGRISFCLNGHLYWKGPLLYVGETLNSNSGSKKKILVKFSQQYGKDLHIFSADQGFAPKLLAFEELPGGWCAVVMDILGASEAPV